MEYRELIPAGMNHLPEYIANLGHIDIINSSFMDMMTDTASWLPVPCEGTVRFLNAKNGYMLDYVRVDPNRPATDTGTAKLCMLPDVLPDFRITVHQKSTYTHRDYLAEFQNAIAQYNKTADFTQSYTRILFVDDRSKDFYVTNDDSYQNIFHGDMTIRSLSSAHADIILWSSFGRKEGSNACRVFVTNNVELRHRHRFSCVSKRVVAASINEVPVEDIQEYIRAANQAYLPLEKVPQDFNNFGPAAQDCIRIYAKSALSEESLKEAEEAREKLETCSDPAECQRLRLRCISHARSMKLYHKEMLKLYTSAEYLRGALEVQQAVRNGASIGMLAVSAFASMLLKEGEG